MVKFQKSSAAAKKRWKSRKYRAKQKEAHKGVVCTWFHTPEVIEKRRLKNLGKKLSQEHKDKISLSSLIQRYHVTTIEEALEIPAFWDVANGITLAKNTHRNTHKSSFGKSISESRAVLCL